jgi:hypothetical protein
MTPRQQKVIDMIRKTVAVWTDGRGNADPLISIAWRESRLTPSAAGDIKNGTAAIAWRRNKAKFVAAKNPWANEDKLWEQSIGLYQLMPANMIDKWHMQADPRILFDPIVATVVAARLWNKTIAMGAKTPVDVRMVWAYGPKGLDFDHASPQYMQRVESEREKWRELGLSGDPARVSAQSFNLASFGAWPQKNQNSIVAQIRGDVGIPDYPPAEQPSSLLGLALFIAAIWGLS